MENTPPRLHDSEKLEVLKMITTDLQPLSVVEDTGG